MKAAEISFSKGSMEPQGRIQTDFSGEEISPNLPEYLYLNLEPACFGQFFNFFRRKFWFLDGRYYLV